MTTDMPLQKTLADLNAGDLVILDSSRYGSESLSVRKIFRVTATQIVLRTLREGMAPLDARYYRDTGRLIGRETYSNGCVRVPTQPLLDRAEKQTIVARLTRHNWKDLHLVTLRAVVDALKVQAPQAAAKGDQPHTPELSKDNP